mmetsp:Transcript_34058/g.81288  ORF Transcript_34058/g.81288 Transcript_34058/m.81288 type:complete len:412 (-) Transcript_34058:72-1307(-)
MEHLPTGPHPSDNCRTDAMQDPNTGQPHQCWRSFSGPSTRWSARSGSQSPQTEGPGDRSGAAVDAAPDPMWGSEGFEAMRSGTWQNAKQRTRFSWMRMLSRSRSTSSQVVPEEAVIPHAVGTPARKHHNINYFGHLEEPGWGANNSQPSSPSSAASAPTMTISRKEDVDTTAGTSVLPTTETSRSVCPDVGPSEVRGSSEERLSVQANDNAYADVDTTAVCPEVGPSEALGDEWSRRASNGSSSTLGEEGEEGAEDARSGPSRPKTSHKELGSLSDSSGFRQSRRWERQRAYFESEESTASPDRGACSEGEARAGHAEPGHMSRCGGSSGALDEEGPPLFYSEDVRQSRRGTWRSALKRTYDSWRQHIRGRQSGGQAPPTPSRDANGKRYNINYFRSPEGAAGGGPASSGA